MIDPELKGYLIEINKNLNRLGRQSKWHSFLNGTLSGLGSIIGVAIALTVIGWVLNVVGVIPAFRKQVNQWQQVIEQSLQVKTTPSSTQKK